MRVLVTGGAGYIGSHTVRHLAKRGYEVLVYDNLSTGHSSSVAGHELIIGDIADREKLFPALGRIDAVLHFAADSSVAESVKNPQKYFANNVGSGLAMLDAILESKISYFILSSTCAVYGLPSHIPISEDAPRAPVNPYGATKLLLEHALEAYSAAYDLQFVSLRYFNAAGADESAEIGELHNPETHVIPCALETASGIRAQFDIYGADYPTPDGTCVRDYVHVNDLAEAHVLALEYLMAGGQSAAFNLGTGRGCSVLDILSAVEDVTESPLQKQLCPRRSGDPAVLVADPSRALRVLQWKASRSLHDMVSTAWNWMQSERNAQRTRASTVSE